MTIASQWLPRTNEDPEEAEIGVEPRLLPRGLAVFDMT